MTIRAVLDTSVLFPPRQRAELQQAAQLGTFAGIWSPWIIAELNPVLTWDWVHTHGATATSERECSRAAKRMMEYLLPTFVLVAPIPPYPPAWEQLADIWDQPIWAAAVQGRAQYVVSENRRHYPPRQPDGSHTHEGITYLPGRAFLALLLKDETFAHAPKGED